MPSRSSSVAALSSFAVGVLLATALAAGCARPHPARQPPVAVTVARVEMRSMPHALLASGTVEPVETANIGSQVGGVVTRIAFREGQDVTAGQALIELDARPFRAALGQAQGQLARDRAQAEALRLAAERAERLYAQNLVSQAEWDASRASAAAMLATVQAESAAVAKARLDLEYATIRAPFGGRTGSLNVHVGDYVKAATAEPLVTVNRIRPIRVRFTVSEDDRAAVERVRGRAPEVRVRPSADDSAEAVGRLTFVDNTIDPATGALVLKAEFPNTDGRLWPGQFVEVRLVLAVQRNALVVPARAITSGQQGTYVYVLNPDSTASPRPVTVVRSDDVSAVVSHGLEAGETVVTDGQFRISPGARVVVREAGSRGKS